MATSSGVTDAPRQLLIVDDEAAVLSALARQLRGEGYVVHQADQIPEALARLAELPIDVVISDYQMPPHDGLTFLAEVRERWPRVQRVLISGAADVSTIASAINDIRVDRFLAKPWDRGQLLATVRGALAQRDLEAEHERVLALLHDANRALEAKVGDRTRLLAVAKGQLEAAFDAIDEPLFVIDAEMRVLRANRALAEDLGRPIVELPGARCFDLRRASARTFGGEAGAACPGCPVERTRAQGSRAEAELSSTDGRSYTVSAYTIDGDERGSVVCAYRDRTEERALGRKLVVTDRLAAIGQLAGGVAHEINNPLAAILALSQLLLRNDPQESADDRREALQEIETASLRCKKIIEGLLRFSRQQTITDEEERPVGVNGLVEETLQLVERRFLVEGVVVERALAQPEPRVRGLSGRLQQVVLNLLTNAFDAALAGRAAGAEGRIRIETRALDGAVELRVGDDGAGVPPALVGRIFEPFFTTKPEGKGTGLGLSISYGIVHDHGGRIEVSSPPGGGATFVVTLPAA